MNTYNNCIYIILTYYNKTIKFVCLKDIIVYSLIYIIKQKLKLKSNESIFIYSNNKIINNLRESVKDIHNKYKDKYDILLLNIIKYDSFG